MSTNNLDILYNFFDKPTKFMNNLNEDLLKKIDNDFVFKLKTLKYDKIVAILLNNGVKFNDNDFELLEIAINFKYYKTIEIIVNYYQDSVDKLFEWGFERKNSNVIEYDINRMSKFYLIDKNFDKNISYIFSQNRGFIKDLMKYRNKTILIPKKFKSESQYKITKKTTK